ncbi:MAG: hypothetical protein IH924_06635 [Proteobacteria bacterium]|nr:hypothetical protein [Pseudomonadota bacterium]MCH9014034.1 hypothetical protein [Pseudomonadota bacterium]
MAQLDRPRRAHDGDACDRQELLAESLVATLGLEGAIHVCHANSWHGILTYVMSATGAGQDYSASH